MTVEERLNQYLQATPQTDEARFVANTATVIGAVTLGPDTSIWYGAILRADINTIRVGRASNLQDGVVVHLSDDHGVTVGDYVTVGHRAILHACTIENETLIGMGATILDGAVIGKQCIIGANALVKQGMTIPDGSLVYGSPARIVRDLDSTERGEIRYWAEKYIKVAAAHREMQGNRP